MEEVKEIFKEQGVNYTEKYELKRGWYSTMVTKITREYNGYGYVYKFLCRGLVMGNKSDSIRWYNDEEDNVKIRCDKEVLGQEFEFECIYSHSKALEDLLSQMLIEISPKTREVEIEGTWFPILWTTPTLTIEHNDDEVDYSIKLNHFKVKKVSFILSEEQMEEYTRRQAEGERFIRFVY